MSNKIIVSIKTIGRIVTPRIMAILVICSILLVNYACTQTQSETSLASKLINIGDTVRYNPYVIYKIGEGIYKINDPGITTGSGGAFGVDFYLVVGEEKALMIDAGNNFIEGHAGNGIVPRKNAIEEIRTIVSGLAGELPLEITLTHTHGDHTGMLAAFIDQNVPIWKSNIENEAGKPKPASRQKPASAVDMSKVYKVFTPGEKTFDLGGGRIVETFPVKGHTNDGVVYIMKNEKILFTGDAFGCGNGPAFTEVRELKDLATDAQKFVDYMFANWAPYERYAIKVFVGHTWNNIFNGYYSPSLKYIDLEYLDWRFIQDMALCANGILEGKWLVPQSGLIYVGDMAKSDFAAKKEGYALMVYGGIGSVMLPIEIAYEAAGLKMPDTLSKSVKLSKNQK